jgi:tetratricopeptide (TPR) repeat protein
VKTQHLFQTALTLGAVALFGACATTSQRAGSTQTQSLETDPILVIAQQDGDQITTEQYDAAELFQEAFHAYQAGRFDEALEKYSLIANHLEGTRFHISALYNGGLSAERLNRWDVAADLYERLVATYGDHEDSLNARFRLALAWQELGRHAEVEELMTELLLRETDLAHYDRIEAHVRRGMALLHLERWTEANQAFQTVLEMNGRASTRHRLADDATFIVQAHYGIGQANHAQMNLIPLVLPPSRMTVDLERKAELHQTAQRAYIRALREHHPYWSVAAGYMIGRLYQDFYLDIFTAEIPDDLSERELTVYFEELRKKIEVLMVRAMSVYERNLSFSRRIRQAEDAEEWVDATALHLSRMRAFLDDPVVQRRAEELVVTGGDLNDLWDTTYYARHAVDTALSQALESVRSAEIASQL